MRGRCLCSPSCAAVSRVERDSRAVHRYRRRLAARGADDSLVALSGVSAHNAKDVSLSPPIGRRCLAADHLALSRRTSRHRRSALIEFEVVNRSSRSCLDASKYSYYRMPISAAALRAGVGTFAV